MEIPNVPPSLSAADGAAEGVLLRRAFFCGVLLGLSMALSPCLHASPKPKFHLDSLDSSISLISFEYVYRDLPTLHSIRDVDFRNLRIFLSYGLPDDHQSYQLKDGRYSQPDPTGGGDLLTERSVQYFANPPGSPERALVSLSDLSCGGSCSENGDVIVFELRGGNLVETQEVVYDLQVPGGGDSFSPQTGVLVVRGRFEDNAAHCCPDAAVVATFKWEGTAFRVQSVKKEAVS